MCFSAKNGSNYNLTSNPLCAALIINYESFINSLDVAVVDDLDG